MGLDRFTGWPEHALEIHRRDRVALLCRFLRLASAQPSALSKSHTSLQCFWSLCLFLVPVLIWNWQHGFPTSHFLVHRGALDEQTRFRPLEVLSFLGQQAGVISPLLFLGLLAAVCWPRLARTPRLETGYLLALFLPLFLALPDPQLSERQPGELGGCRLRRRI